MVLPSSICPSRGRIKELNRPAVRRPYEDSERYYAPYGSARSARAAKDRAGNAGKRVVEIATVPEHGGLDKLKLVLACWQRKSNSRGFAQTLSMTHSGWNNEKSPIYSKVTKRPLNENSLAYGITDRGSPTIHTRSWTWFWPR